jgi:hypothetical protein
MSQPQNPPSILDTTLANDGFWPDVSVRAVFEGYRLQTDGRDQMLIRVLLESMVDTNDALKAAKAQAQAAGFATLAAYADSVPDDVVNDEPIVSTLYLSALGNLVKARFVKRRQDQQRRPVPETETQGSDNTEAYFLDEHQNAVARLLNRMAPGASNQTNYGVYVASLGD